MMAFVSIAERELRVAARKRATYVLRVFSSGTGLVVTGFTLWVITLFGGAAIPGNYLFLALSWIAFGCACLFGCGVTADVISEEKREGTLGLLFLTPLRGHSIVLGKFSAHGLRTLYSVLAIIPVMALPVLIGGTDIASLGRTTLAVIETLALSLVIGLFFSTLCRRGWVASGLSLTGLMTITVTLPCLAVLLRAFRKPGSELLLLFSPSYALSMASWTARGLTANHFWRAIFVQSVEILLLLGLTSILIPLSWREAKVGKRTASIRSIWRGLKYGSRDFRARLRSKFLAINPILWLCARQWYPNLFFVSMVALLGMAIVALGKKFADPKVTYDEFLLPVIMWLWVLPMLYVLFCFLLAVRGSERFAADRKSGALELILSTPASVKTIIRGQWLALFREFWGGALFLLLLHGFVLYYLMQGMQIDAGVEVNLVHVFRGTIDHLRGVTNISEQTPFFIGPLAIFSAGFLIVVLWIALGWTSMFMAMRIPKAAAVPFLAFIALAVPPPLMVLVFAGTMAWQKWLSDDVFLRILSLGTAGFFFVLSNALFWLFFCRAWLYRNFRMAATDRYQGPKKWFRIV
jgi:ABC-type transport system involved in multi-copper enzyme maturation permease subunit